MRGAVVRGAVAGGVVAGGAVAEGATGRGAVAGAPFGAVVGASGAAVAPVVAASEEVEPPPDCTVFVGATETVFSGLLLEPTAAPNTPRAMNKAVTQPTTCSHTGVARNRRHGVRFGCGDACT